MQNPFANAIFRAASMTAAINLYPNRYGKLEALKLMPIKSVLTRQIIVQERNGVLSLLPSLPPGSPGTVGTRGKRKARSFVVPHIPHDDVVLPDEVQGVVPFGVEGLSSAAYAQASLETVAGVMAEKLDTMRNKHAITLEHLRMGALKGVILDADGSELYDLFEEFKITPKTIHFELNVPETNVKEKCLAVSRHIEDHLLGEFMTGVHVLCSPEFFSWLTSHPKVEKAYENFQNGAVLINDMRTGFNFGGLTFEEYRGQASDMDGNPRRFIAEGDAHAFPMGTLSTFATYAAPADFNETANTPGQAIYAKQEPRKFDRGTDIHTQSNPLPMCHRPGILVTLKAGG